MPALFNDTLYYGGVGLPLLALGFSNAQLVSNASSKTTASFSYPGTTPSISANGSTNAIVWAVENAGARGVLHAYDAGNLAHEFYNSSQAPNGRDSFQDNKFITPTIANSKVYVGTPNSVAVFGPIGPDLLWQDTDTGDATLWLMNGTNFQSAALLGIQPTEFRLMGAADFNNDGNADLLWQDTVTGEIILWLMNGTDFQSAVTLAIEPTKFRLVAAADFNNDGHPDLLWQDTVTGDIAVWLMNGTTFQAFVPLATEPTRFGLVGTADFN